MGGTCRPMLADIKEIGVVYKILLGNVRRIQWANVNIFEMIIFN
jgi:hypothetical protein